MKVSVEKKLSQLVMAMMVIAGVFYGCAKSSVLTVTPEVSVANLTTGATSIAVERDFDVSFTPIIDTSTVSTATLFVVERLSTASIDTMNTVACNSSNAVAAEVDCESQATCTLNPSSNLDGATNYLLCVMPSISFSSGTYDGGIWSFTTVGVSGSNSGGSSNSGDSSGSSADTTSPTVAISLAGPGIVTASPFTITVTFSEEIENFALSDLTVTNGTVSNLIEVTSDRVYTAAITPSGDPVTVNVLIPAGAVTDAAENANTTSNAFAVRYDTASLTVGLTDTVPAVTNSTSVQVTATFSEEVIGFTAGDLTITNGTLSNFNSDANPVFTFDIAPNASGTVSIALAADIATDLSGLKDNLAATTLSFTSDITSPSVAITSAESDLTVENPFSVTITFSEDINNFVVGDITLSNATASNFTETTADRVYTVDINPTSEPASINVSINAGVVTDNVGNTNTASNTFAIYFDTATLTAVIGHDGGAITNLASTTGSATFVEAVTGFTLDDLSIINGTVSNLSTLDNIIFNFDITPAGDGAVTVGLAADRAVDALTGLKSNEAATNLVFTSDRTAPTVSSTGPADLGTEITTETTVLVSFDSAMSVSSVTANTTNTTCSGSIQLSDDNFTTCIQMGGAPSASNGNRDFTVSPAVALSSTTNYKIRVTTGVTDVAGNALASTFTQANGFTTVALPRIWVTATVPPADMSGKAGATGIARADAYCNDAGDGNHPGSGTYKALLVDGNNRIACTTANCATGGATENVDWVMSANQTYIRPDGTVIGTTTAAGILTTFTNPIVNSGTDVWVWTGMQANYTTLNDNHHCFEWTVTGAQSGLAGNAKLGNTGAIYSSATLCSGTIAKLTCVEQ